MNRRDQIITTIAWDGKSLAADSQRTFDGDIRTTTGKIKTVNGTMFACAGDAANAIKFESYMDSKDHSVLDKITDVFEALVVDPDGIAYVYDGHKVAIPAPVPCAIGTGAKLALGAMLAGADAETAVRLACSLDVYSSEPVQCRTYLSNSDTTSDTTCDTRPPSQVQSPPAPLISAPEQRGALPPQSNLETKLSSSVIRNALWTSPEPSLHPCERRSDQQSGVSPSGHVLKPGDVYSSVSFSPLEGLAENLGGKQKSDLESANFFKKEKELLVDWENWMVSRLHHWISPLIKKEPNSFGSREKVRRLASSIVRQYHSLNNFRYAITCDLTNNPPSSELINVEVAFTSAAGGVRVFRWGNPEYMGAIL